MVCLQQSSLAFPPGDTEIKLERQSGDDYLTAIYTRSTLNTYYLSLEMCITKSTALFCYF